VFDILDRLGVAGKLTPGLDSREWLLWFFAISFVIANPIIYIKQALEKRSLENHIAELEATGANLRLKLKSTGFTPSGTRTRRPFPEIKVDSYGFDEHGVPGWGVIWANLQGENIGWEAGRLIWEFDRDKTKLPSLFDQDFVFDEGASDQLFWNESKSIERRHSFKAHLQINVRIVERDPKAFAQALNSLVSYRVVIDYRTKPIVGEPNPRAQGQLVIEGDFQEFRQQLRQSWGQSRYRELTQFIESK
jgi:hypothetical protein